MLRSPIDLELGSHLPAQLALRQHALDRLFQNSLGPAGSLLGIRFLPQTTRETRVAVIDLLLGLHAGYLDLLGIDHDDVMAHVDKRRVFRIRFAGENTRGLAGKAAERLPLGIYHVPLALDILATRDVS